ncbi:hypothetical protein Pvag_pPag10110 (plasmid) [Pantoea vagans C9-1]|nr:hypothetical protein Pvag_pPag10110 [Pantoea vagans C9-1]
MLVDVENHGFFSSSAPILLFCNDIYFYIKGWLIFNALILLLKISVNSSWV